MTSQTMTVRAAHFGFTGADDVGNRPLTAELSGPAALRAGGHWVALRTRSRQERILAGELVRGGMSAWTPTALAAERFGDCSVLVERPVIPGYVFLHGDADDVARANATGRVLDVIGFDDQSRIGRDLANLSRITAGLEPLDPASVASVREMVAGSVG